MLISLVSEFSQIKNTKKFQMNPQLSADGCQIFSSTAMLNVDLDKMYFHACVVEHLVECVVEI